MSMISQASQALHSEIAWQNGQLLPRKEVGVSPGDAGFVLGATITEQLRTIRGELFLPDAHAERLAGSLAAIGIEPGQSLNEIFAAAATVASHNHALLTATTTPAAADLGLVIFVTPGDLASQHEGRAGRPSTTIHTFPLATKLWAAAYTTGVSLRCVSVEQVPASCWPVAAKVRSRLHYFLAEREAAALEPGARPLLAYADGRISETSTANLAIVCGTTIITPPTTDALGGTSLGFLRQLTEQAGFSWQARSLRRDELLQADEILLTSTPWCLQAAVHLDGIAIGEGTPGPCYRQLLQAWSDAVGLDIVGQAQGELA